MNPNDAQEKKSGIWPAMIIGLLLGGIGVNVLMMTLALSDPSFAVESDYYKKALRWDQEMAQRKQNAKLGWSVKLKATPTAGSQMQLQLQVLDAKKGHIKGATVTLVAYHNARAAHKIHRRLQTAATPVVSKLPLPRRGLWVFRLVVKRKGQTFTHTIQQEV